MSVPHHWLARCGLATVLLFAPCMAVEAAGPADDPPSAAEIEHALGGAGDTAPASETDTVAVQSIVVPFVAEGGHIVIEASLDGHPPRPFFLDSGARTTVTREAAQDLDAASDGDRLMAGFGPHLVAAKVVTARKIALGAAVIEDQKLLVAELRNGLVDRGSKPRLAGLIGAELLRKYTVRIDYHNRRLTLIPPGRFEPPAEGFSLPLTTQIRARRRRAAKDVVGGNGADLRQAGA
ncbi:aspartyl protease family protein [Telmatospirillum siberiense]|nr:aspartyl protease family protein [Telmatospirillum siberiense]